MKKTTMMTTILLGALLLTMTGCSTAVNSDTTTLTSATASSSASADTDTAQAVSMSYTEDAAEATDLFTSRDLIQTADLTDATYITVSTGTINITEESVYVLSGTAADCTVCIEAEDSDKVQIVLDGVSITNSDFPVIYVVNADKKTVAAFKRIAQAKQGSIVYYNGGTGKSRHHTLSTEEVTRISEMVELYELLSEEHK